jgi:putative addiction module CopG family antidote
MAGISCSDAMNVELTPERKAFAQRAIESGRLNSEDNAVRQALALWEEHERQRAEFLLTLSEAKASVARGEAVTLLLRPFSNSPWK